MSVDIQSPGGFGPSGLPFRVVLDVAVTCRCVEAVRLIVAVLGAVRLLLVVLVVWVRCGFC